MAKEAEVVYVLGRQLAFKRWASTPDFDPSDSTATARAEVEIANVTAELDALIADAERVRDALIAWQSHSGPLLYRRPRVKALEKVWASEIAELQDMRRDLLGEA